MVENETEMVEVKSAKCGGEPLGERVTNGIGMTNTFALYNLDWLLADRLRRKWIDSYWFDGSSPELKV